MSLKLAVCVLLLSALACACSSEDVRRTTYETLQNVGEQQCDKDLSGDCPERQSYDEYHRSRQESAGGD